MESEVVVDLRAILAVVILYVMAWRRLRETLHGLLLARGYFSEHCLRRGRNLVKVDACVLCRRVCRR